MMSAFRASIFAAGFTLLLNACSSAPKHLVEDVKEGMDKDQVLDTAGNPARTFRTNGQDHWIYVFYQGSQEMARDVVFEENRVVSIGRPVGKENWTKTLESIKKDKGDGFKTIDGGSEDPNKP